MSVLLQKPALKPFEWYFILFCAFCKCVEIGMLKTLLINMTYNIYWEIIENNAQYFGTRMKRLDFKNIALKTNLYYCHKKTLFLKGKIKLKVNTLNFITEYNPSTSLPSYISKPMFYNISLYTVCMFKVQFFLV